MGTIQPLDKDRAIGSSSGIYSGPSVDEVTGERSTRQDDSSNSTHGKSSSTPEGSSAADKTGTPKGRSAARKLPSVPDFLKPPSNVGGTWTKFKALLAREANFYRIHVIVFTLTPLIFAAIMYASNTNPVAFIDCLFVCVSAMTVTGLTTINVSTLSDWQQAILFFLMTIGNISSVSIIMVFIRRHFFRQKFNDVIKRSETIRRRMNDVEEAHQKEKKRELIRLQRMIGLRKKADTEGGEASSSDESPYHTSSPGEPVAAATLKKKSRKKQGPLRASMVRRMDEPAVLINQAGMPSRAVKDDSQEDGLSAANAGGILSSPAEDVTSSQDIRFALPQGSDQPSRQAPGLMIQSPEEMEDDPLSASVAPESSHNRLGSANNSSHPRGRSKSVSEHTQSSLRLRSPRALDATGSNSGLNPETLSSRPFPDAFPRTQTIEFSEPFVDRSRRTQDSSARTTAMNESNPYTDKSMRHRSVTLDIDRQPTMASARSYPVRRPTGVVLARTPTTARERGFGGFPTPLEIAGQAAKRVFPKLQKHLTRTTTMPRTATFASTHSAGNADGSGFSGFTKPAPYLTFDATVSRNSRFQELTEAQRDELGGVEYRAIDLLSKILIAYFLSCIFFCVVLVAPWLATGSARAVHEVIAQQGVYRPDTTWLWFFQVMSAYSNTGLSLIDSSMIELATQYFMLIPTAFLILAGNTAFPIFLRFFIWCISLVVPKTGRTYETLRFLLDHPRRCFVYLFPSAQTWFLLAVVIFLNCTDWVFFEILDLGNPIINGWSIGQRIFDGLFQSIAVRAAGFQIISLLTLAPAVQFLYIVMMYISAYPIAMSVRNTNVYEERSLGIYNEEPGTAYEPQTGGARVWGTYLAAHARRQLAFDIWWLGFSLWLVCIIERTAIVDATTNGWFTVFNCLFELTSAYGTVGLSTGTPFDDFSLSGRFSTLGKLVVIAVMLRGRHRGLPVAIDRAVLLPGELELEDEAQENDRLEEEDFIRSRTMTPSASTNVFPRTPTRASTQLGTPRMAKASREMKATSLDLDGGARGDYPSNDYTSTEEAEPDLDRNGLPYHLSAIQEQTPSSTPIAMSRVTSYKDASPTKRRTQQDGTGTSSASSSASEEGDAEESGMLGSSKLAQLPSAVDTQNSEREDQVEENRMKELNRRYQEKYGSVPSDQQD